MIGKKTTVIVILIISFAFMYSTFISETEFVTGQQGRNVLANVGSGFAGGVNDTNHTVCMGNACVVVFGNGTDQCQTDADCMLRYDVRRAVKHTECFVNSWGVGYCAVVNGTGVNECSLTNSWQDCNKLDCSTNGSAICSYVAGRGSDLCSPVGSYCGNATHNICQNNACVTVQGNGTNQCLNNSDCNTANQTMPDLIISSLSVNVTYHNETRSNVSVTTVVSNIGTILASPSTLRLNYNSQGAWVPDSDVYVGYIAPGSSYYTLYSWPFPDGHNWTLNATTDYYNLVNESNEWNNGAYEIFST